MSPEEREAIARRHAAQVELYRGNFRGALLPQTDSDVATLLAALATVEDALAACAVMWERKQGDVDTLIAAFTASEEALAASDQRALDAETALATVRDERDAALAALHLARTAAASAALRIGQVEAERDIQANAARMMAKVADNEKVTRERVESAMREAAKHLVDKPDTLEALAVFFVGDWEFWHDSAGREHARAERRAAALRAVAEATDITTSVMKSGALVDLLCERLRDIGRAARAALAEEPAPTTEADAGKETSR